MTEVCSWPEGREEAIVVGVNEITAGRSIKQRKKGMDSEQAKWDFNHLPRLAANSSGSYEGVANQPGKGNFCTEVLAWELCVQHLGQLGISSLISLTNPSLSRFRELAGDRVWVGEKLFTWQLGSTGKRQNFSVWLKFGIMYGTRGSEIVWQYTKHSCCSARVQAKFSFEFLFILVILRRICALLETAGW